MPELKDKYSDSNLNQSQQDYDEKFNETVGHPDMQALDDQGDAVARELGDAESKVPATKNTNELSDSASVNRAEKRQKEPGNRFYAPDSTTKKSPLRVRTWSKKRKAAVFGGIGGAFGGILIAAFMMLPFKVIGILQMVTNEAGQRVEQITEQRAKVIMARAILTKFGNHKGIVITGEGAFSTLLATMREAKLEKKLAAKGLTIEETRDGVKLRVDGSLLENGKNLKTDADVWKALDGKPLTNQMIKSLIKEEIQPWHWMKRAKFAKWMRIKYGILKYGGLKSDKETTEEKRKDVDLERTTAANGRTTARFTELLSCIMTGACEMIDGNTPAPKPSDTAVTEDGVNTTADESTAEIEKTGRKDAAKTMTKMLVERLGTKIIPYIGWIDLVATVNHMVYETGKNDYLGKVAAAFKGASYAVVFAEWAGNSSQGALGAMDPEIMGFLAEDLDGAESAASWQAVEGKSGGVPIETQVNSDDTSQISKVFNKFYNSPAALQYKYITRPVLEGFYQTIGSGGLLGWAGSHLGNFLGFIISATMSDAQKQAVEAIANKIVEVAGPFLLKTFGLTIDPLASGAELMNNIFGGGIVSFNDFCKEIGCRKLSNPLVYEQNQRIAAERAEYLKQKGPLYALFSPEETKSVTSQIAMTMPTSTTSAMGSLGRIVTDIPARLASVIAPNSYAASSMATYEKLFAVQGYGATLADLNAPMNKNVEDGEDCPETKEGDYNGCSVDNYVVDVMNCSLSIKELPDCDPESGGAGLNSGAGGTLRVATFNMRGASHTGGNFSGRMDLSIAAMKKHGFEVIGAQELQKPQRKYLMQKMKSVYDIFPCPIPVSSSPVNNCDNDRHSVENSILWDRSRYKFVKGDYIPGGVKYFGGSPLNAPWVLLEDIANGQQIYILNTHDPAFPENAFHRYNNGKLHAKFINELAGSGLPVVMTGDFNSGYSAKTSGGNVTWQKKHENTIYCTMLSAGISDALDLSEKLTPKCPGNPKGYGNPIDHIFVSKGLDATNYTKIAGGYVNNGSDHPTYFADVLIPGTAESGAQSVDGWTWPVAKAKWPKSSMPISECGLIYREGTIHTGIDIAVPTGTPLLAATAGEVVYTGGGYGMITIKATKTVGGSPIYVNYQHLSKINVRKGTKVVAGQPIGNSGATGAPQGPHLHFSTWKVSILSGHSSPSSAEGKATLSKMYHPMNFMPKDGRNLNECKEPYALPN